MAPAMSSPAAFPLMSRQSKIEHLEDKVLMQVLPEPQAQEIGVVTVQVFSNVCSTAALKDMTLDGRLAAALIRPTVIGGLECLLSSSLSSIIAHHRGAPHQETKSVPTEILYNLSPGKKISYALQQFGSTDQDTDVIAVTVDTMPRKGTTKECSDSSSSNKGNEEERMDDDDDEEEKQDGGGDAFYDVTELRTPHADSVRTAVLGGNDDVVNTSTGAVVCGDVVKTLERLMNKEAVRKLYRLTEQELQFGGPIVEGCLARMACKECGLK